jgi:hypothetical protein
MSTLFASFEPTEDVGVLLASLRQAGLAWIADEIEEVIRNGFSVVKQSQSAQDKNNGHRVMPFDADEQLRITLRAIQRYTVELHKIWHWTQDDLRETLENPNLQVSIAYLGSQESIHLFNQDFETHLAKLDELLRRAWPGSAESYDFVEEP